MLAKLLVGAVMLVSFMSPAFADDGDLNPQPLPPIAPDAEVLGQFA